MRRWGLIVAAWMLAPAAFAQQVVQEQPVTLQLDVDTQGQIAAAKVMDPQPLLMPGAEGLVKLPPRYGPLPPVLAQAAAQVASKWRFSPILASGKPVTGRTWATAMLQVVKREDGNFGVALRYLRNGPYMDYVVMPRYPQRMGVLHKSGALAVEYMVQPDGTIKGLRVLKAAGDATSHQGIFEDAVREALGGCRELPLLIDGKAVVTRVRTVYTFTIANRPKGDANRLSRQVRDAVGPNVSSNFKTAPLASGEAVAIDSPFLKQPAG
jgi:hypothetical protein